MQSNCRHPAVWMRCNRTVSSYPCKGWFQFGCINSNIFFSVFVFVCSFWFLCWCCNEAAVVFFCIIKYNVSVGGVTYHPASVMVNKATAEGGGKKRKAMGLHTATTNPDHVTDIQKIMLS